MLHNTTLSETHFLNSHTGQLQPGALDVQTWSQSYLTRLDEICPTDKKIIERMEHLWFFYILK